MSKNLFFWHAFYRRSSFTLAPIVCLLRIVRLPRHAAGSDFRVRTGSGQQLFCALGLVCMHALAGGVSYPVLPRLRLRPPPDRLRLSRSTRTSSMPSVFITPEKPRTTLTSSMSSLFITNPNSGVPPTRPMIIGDRRRIPPLSIAATLLSQSELSTYHAVKQAGHQR
jgi:hypothetical protein